MTTDVPDPAAAPLPADAAAGASKLGDIAAAAGLRRIHVLAWRDLADVEAGGSELHAATVCRLWAEAGLDVTMRTSYAAGAPTESVRDGYRVLRRAGRYLVFPRAVASEIAGRHGERDGLVEIWNGVPWLSPVWARGPKVTWLHHVHGPMWSMVLPPGLARAGALVERRLAPPFYRRTPVITLSPSSQRELVEGLHLRADHVHVVPPGIDPRFSPGGQRAPEPLVVAVGRLMPVKRFDHLVTQVLPLRAVHPGLRLVIIGEGAEREPLQTLIDANDAADWITLAGRVDDATLVGWYREAWLVASASVAEGWGMTLTEAAACGTPAVATDIAGHRDAIADGRSGVLAPPDRLGAAIGQVLGDRRRREQLERGALTHAAAFTWEATAAGTLRVLAGEARRAR